MPNNDDPNPKNAEEFVALFRNQADSSIKEYLHPDSQSFVGGEFHESQMEQIRKVVEQTVMESYFHFLLGLDGSPVGGVRQRYQLRNEDGALLNTPGEIHKMAIKYFYE